MRPSFYLGLCGIALAIGVRLWCLILLHQVGIITKSDLAGVTRPLAWTRRGPYRVLRHPVYLAFLLLIASVGVIALDWPGVVLALPAVPFYATKMALEDELRRLYEPPKKEKGGS